MFDIFNISNNAIYTCTPAFDRATKIQKKRLFLPLKGRNYVPSFQIRTKRSSLNIQPYVYNGNGKTERNEPGRKNERRAFIRNRTVGISRWLTGNERLRSDRPRILIFTTSAAKEATIRHGPLRCR